MKVVTAKAMAELEAIAYRQGFLDQDFMEKAGEGIASAIIDFLSLNPLGKNIVLLCGKGNNGGDAYVAGYYLLQKGYSVKAIQAEPFDQCSPLCQKNGKRFLESGGKSIPLSADLTSFDVIVDGLFGTGFRGDVKEPYRSLIEAANKSKVPILAVDIPSGLNGTTGESGGKVICATETIFLGLPKTGFFLEGGWNSVGKLKGVDFGMPSIIIDNAIADLDLMTDGEVSSMLPPIKRTRQKYQAGLVIGLAGSPGMPGAALLSSLAAYRTGSGMVRLLHPDGMQAELANSPYELIKISYQAHQTDEVLQLMQKGGATFVGPGLGRTEEIIKLLSAVVPSLEKPCVIDADALTLYADNPFKLPEHVVFTPHTGEMQTLLHQKNKLTVNFETLAICQRYAEEKNVTLLLKGAPTFIFQSHETVRVNPTGDPGMATAGSGDVLTGIIASLLSQGLSCHDAATLGAYLHGLAGEYAAQAHESSYGIIASDLIDHLQDAYKRLKK